MDRLIIRNFKVEDWRDLYECLSQKDVLKYEPENVWTEETCKLETVERSKGGFLFGSMS